MLKTLTSRLSAKWFGRWAPQALVCSADQLTAGLAEEAAHVAQSTTYSYLRARAGFMAPKLFAEPAFLDALEVTRWEAFAAVLADFVVIAAGTARAHLGMPPDRAAALWTGVYRRALAVYPPPPHRPDGWQGFEDTLASRLAHGQARPPEPPDLVALHAGKALYENLPLHPSVRRLDEELVVNSVRFRLLRGWENLAARIDWRAVATDLGNGAVAPN